MDIKKINYKSDFTLRMHSDAGWGTGFRIRFRASGSPQKRYCACHDGNGKYCSCHVDAADPSTLVVEFDDHHMGIGVLLCEITYSVADESSPTGKFDTVVNEAPVVATIGGKEYKVILDIDGDESAEIIYELPAYVAEEQRQAAEAERQEAEAGREEAEAVRQELAAHPLYVGEDYFVYQYDLASHEYQNTGVYLKGSVSIEDFVYVSETETHTTYSIIFSDGTTESVDIPKGVKGDKGDTGNPGPQGAQGPKGDTVIIGDEQTYTLYGVTGQNSDGAMTQKAVTDALVGDAISYDNSQSGLAADNVQGALDEVAEDLQEETPYNLNNYITRNGSLTPTNGWNWDSSHQRGKHKAIPVTEGELLHITMQTVGTNAGNYCGWLTTDYVEGNQQSHNPIPYVSGTSRFMVDDLLVRVPEDAAWLCVTVLDGGGYTINSSVSKVTKVKDKIAMHHEELSNCHDGNKIKSSQSKTAVWTSADFANTTPGYGTNAKRVLLKPASMLDVSDVYKIVLSVPYSAVEEAQVDWCMICFYNNGKAVLTDLTTPSFNFEGNDVSIEIDLSEDKYAGINYISPYFGSDSNIDIASIDWTAISVTAYKYVLENARAVAEYTEVVNISDYPYVNCIMKSGTVTSKGKTTNTGYCVWENNNTTGYGRWGKFVPIEAGATYRIKGGSLDTVYAFTINNEHTEGRVKNFAGEEQTYIALSANEERLIVAPYNAAYLYFTVRDNTEGYPKELSSVFKVSPRVDEDVTRIDKDLYKTYGWYTDISLWEMGFYNINTGVKQTYAENATLYIMTKTRIAGTPKFRSTNPKIKLMLMAWDGDTWLGAWNGSEFSSVSVDIEKMCFSEIDIAGFKDYGYSFALQMRYMDQVYIPLSYSNYVQIFSESISAVSDLMEFKDALDDYIPPVVLMNADKESLIASLCNVTTPSASADLVDSDYFFAHDYLCFAHISDTHSWNKNVEHAVDIVNSGMFYNIDFLIHTGDIQRALYHDVQEAVNLWTDYVDTMKGSAKPALTCVGNHEHEKMDSISGFYNRYMKYMVDKEWLVEGTNIINGKPYWYKDFDKYKVRLIALDDFEAPYDSYYANKNYSNDIQLSPEQVEWFVDVLNSVPADYTVIIAMHAPCSDSSNSTKINPEWSTTNTQGVQPMHMSEHPIWDIVDAYQNKGTLSKTYTYTDNNVQTAWGNWVVDADFSSANGIFAFYIHGHNHVDYIHKFNAFPNQIHVAVAGGVVTKRWDDCGRSRYGKSYDSINVYVLNTDTHTVHIVKLGATMRRDGIERNHTSFTYYVPET